MTCLRQTIEDHYGEKPVGMGGTFVVQKGKVKTHIMVRGQDSRAGGTHTLLLKVLKTRGPEP